MKEKHKSNKYRPRKQYKNTVKTSTHIIKSLTHKHTTRMICNSYIQSFRRWRGSECRSFKASCMWQQSAVIDTVCGLCVTFFCFPLLIIILRLPLTHLSPHHIC